MVQSVTRRCTSQQAITCNFRAQWPVIWNHLQASCTKLVCRRVCRLVQSTSRCVVATAMCTAAVPLSNVHRPFQGASKYAETQTDSNGFHLHKYMTLPNSLFKTPAVWWRTGITARYLCETADHKLWSRQELHGAATYSSDGTRVNSNVQCGLMLEQTVMLLCK